MSEAPNPLERDTGVSATEIEHSEPREPTALEEARRSATILFAFVVIFTACLSGAYLSTKTAIDASAAEATLAKIEEVLPSRLYNNALLRDTVRISANPALGQTVDSLIYRARLNGKPSALVAEAVAPDGYAGKIRLIVAIDAHQKLLGVRVVEHKETPGLGDYIEPRKDKNKAHAWILQFTDLALADLADAEWRVRKDGGQFDYRTGATVTPRAVIKAVHKAERYLREQWEVLFLAQAVKDKS
jgi:Na+-translocating ferredoxin:NAD+ oxidoreductase subunit G